MFIAVLLALVATCAATERIINGKPADFAHNYLTLLTLTIEWGMHTRCTGTWISHDTILTARHCLVHNETNVMFSRGTASYAAMHTSTQNLIHFTSWGFLFPHIEGTVVPDVGVIKVTQPVPKWYPGFATMRLPTEGEGTRVGQMARVSGWGRVCSTPPYCTEKEEKLTGVAQTVVIEVKSVTDYVPKHPITISAGGCKNRTVFHDKEGGGKHCRDIPSGEKNLPTGTCKGDSGGPLVCEGANGTTPYICGIVSTGQVPCGYFTSSFVDVTEHRVRSFIVGTLESPTSGAATIHVGMVYIICGFIILIRAAE
jgi:secreted trypsin-like serine protease